MSSKQCVCGNTDLVLISTYRMKYCPDCTTWIYWPLDDGQTSLYGGKPITKKAQEKTGNAIYRGEKADTRRIVQPGGEVAQAVAECGRARLPDSYLGMPLGLEWGNS